MSRTARVSDHLENQMSKKVAKLLAVTAALAGTGMAAAQTTSSLFGFSLASILESLGFSVTEVTDALLPVASVVLFLLFARFGGFRWLY
jgi:hypothetical protein